MGAATSAAYAVLYPLFLPMHLAMGKGLRDALAKAKAAAPVPSMLSRDPTTADLPTAKAIDPPVELDYLEHRSAAYVAQLVLDACWEAARALTGENAAEDVSDADLVRDLLGSPVAFMTSRDGDAWVMDLEPTRSRHWWNVDRFEVVRFVTDERARFEITDAQGRTHRPGDATWRGAKRKLIAQLALWQPAEGHAWSHFWLPDVVSATVHEAIPRDTNLYRLLAPHARFANRHNHAGLWIQRASDNEPTFGKSLIPWLALPRRKLELRFGLMEEAGRYHRSADHFALPERMDRRLPYFAYLGAYFDVTQAFVDRLMPHLEADAYAKWAEAVEPWYPGFSKVPMARALAMIVWHMGIAHAADHLTYVAWARRYGTSEVEPSIEALSTQRPSAYARYRFLAFLNNFADYRPPTTGLDLRLVTSDEAYGFTPGSPAEGAAKQFVAELRATDAALATQGLQLVPVDRLIRAICF